MPKLTIYRAFVLPNHHTHGGTEKRQPECKGALLLLKNTRDCATVVKQNPQKGLLHINKRGQEAVPLFPPPTHIFPSLLFCYTLSFGLCFLPPIPPPCSRNSCWVGYFITKHSFYTSKKDPVSPVSQYDGKPCATCTRKPHLKGFFFLNGTHTKSQKGCKGSTLKSKSLQSGFLKRESVFKDASRDEGEI